MSKNILVRPGESGSTDLEIAAVIVNQNDPYGVYVLDKRMFDMREVIDVTPLDGGCIVNTSQGEFDIGMIRENYDTNRDDVVMSYMKGEAIAVLLLAVRASLSNGLVDAIPELVRRHLEGRCKETSKMARTLTLSKKNIVLQWPCILGWDPAAESLTGEVLAELTEVVSYKKSWRGELTLNLKDGSAIEIKNGPSFVVNMSFNAGWEEVATSLNIPRV